MTKDCPRCHGCGEGMYDGDRCMVCNGKGYIVSEENDDGYDDEQDDL
jgi:RecJ-like exonuclease